MLREMGTPVPIEAPVLMEVIVEFIVAGVRVEVPEKEMLEEPVPPMSANGPE